MTQRQQIIPLRGGLDLVTPGMLKKPGASISCQNYEVEAQGYARCSGYERFDGRFAPSAANYCIVNFHTGIAQIFVGDQVTAPATAFVGTVMEITVTSGTWGADAAGFFVAGNYTNLMIDGDTIRVAGIQKALANGVPVPNGAVTDVADRAYLAQAAALSRAAIVGPVGSGPVRGVATYGGNTYCWRNNAGGTACVMFKATTAGWVAESLGAYLKFDAGLVEILEGSTVNGLTSGAMGLVVRSVRNTGTWGSDAAGYVALTGIIGTFQNNETLRVAAVNHATVDGVRVNVTLPAGGKYRTAEHNFYATATTRRLYFANGVGRAYEFGSGVLCPVFTGLSDALDKPEHIAEFADHLFLSFTGGSVQHSSIGEPLIFNAITGAGEVGVGQTVTGMKSNTSDSLIITSRNQIRYITGTSSADFIFKRLSDSSGAVADTLEVVNKPLFLDDLGVRSLTAVQDYGDWKTGTMTMMVEPWIAAKKAANIVPVGAIRVRSKDQYRLYYADGMVLLIYVGRNEPECMVLKPNYVAYSLFSGEDTNGNEVLFAGAEDGYVYQLDRGTSFDGEIIEAFLRLAFMNQGSPNAEKRYHRIRINGRAASSNTQLSVSSEFSYGSQDQPPSSETALTFYGNGGFWDEANYEAFSWDSAIEGQLFADANGLGENISVAFLSDSAVEQAHQLSMLTINYSNRRALR